MLLGKFNKQPGEIESYGVDYTDATNFDETIVGVTALAENVSGAVSDLFVTPCSIAGKEVRVQLGSGTDGNDYKITFTVDTSTGRRLQDEIILKVQEV